MDTLLTQLFYFARPLMGIAVPTQVLGFAFSEFWTIVFTFVLGLLASYSAIARGN